MGLKGLRFRDSGCRVRHATPKMGKHMEIQF